MEIRGNRGAAVAAFLCLFLLMGGSCFAAGEEEAATVAQPVAEQVEAVAASITPDIGIFQVILEGEPGQGGLFYRLEFATDGTVTVKQQFDGQNISEVKQWSMTGDRITIQSADGDVLTDFDGAVMTYDAEGEGNIVVNEMASFEPFNLSYWNGLRANLYILLTVFVLIAFNELFRHYKWTGIVFFFVLPIALFPVWTSYGIEYWFKWAKVYSVVFASCWFLLMRYTNLDKYNFAKMVCALFLAINITEAVMQDFTMGYLPNILNGIAGVLSIITCFYGWKGIQADDSKEKDMVWPMMTTLWIIAYDVWNFVYVYLNFPGSATAQFQVIMAATIPALFIKKGSWLQARGFTLAVWFMFYFTFADFHGANLVVLPRNDASMLAVSVLSIVLNIACVFALAKTVKKNKQNKLQAAVAA